MPSVGHAGSKTLLQQNPPVLTGMPSSTALTLTNSLASHPFFTHHQTPTPVTKVTERSTSYFCEIQIPRTQYKKIKSNSLFCMAAIMLD